MKRALCHPALSIGAVAAVAVGALAGCAGGNASGSTQQNISLAGVSIFAQDPYWLTVQCGAQDAAKKAGVSLKWFAGQGQDLSESQASLNSALLTDPDAVLPRHRPSTGSPPRSRTCRPTGSPR